MYIYTNTYLSLFFLLCFLYYYRIVSYKLINYNSMFTIVVLIYNNKSELYDYL